GQKNYTRKFQKKENIEKTESGTDDYKEFIMFLKEIDRSVTFIPFSIIGDVPLLDEDIKYSYNLEIKQIIDSPESFLWPQIRIISGLIEAIENSISNTFEKIDLFYEDDIKDMVVNDIQSIVNDFFADGIKRQLRKYTPIKDIGLSESFSVKISNGMIFLSNVKLQFFVNNQWIQWDFLSDGTKRMFQFILEVLGEENLVLIEEPELGIHPTQLNLLMDFLKEQSSHKQIILSTHAPTVLNILEKDEIDRILVVKWDQRNYTNIENMSETKIVKVCEFMRTKGLLSEYWLHHDMEV
ncbi:MAG: ATP-binding protein, partial [Ignavibacteria bacterium]|nr:ATP-binding protein [Ignavibacteria bacterium]